MYVWKFALREMKPLFLGQFATTRPQQTLRDLSGKTLGYLDQTCGRDIEFHPKMVGRCWMLGLLHLCTLVFYWPCNKLCDLDLLKNQIFGRLGLHILTYHYVPTVSLNTGASRHQDLNFVWCSGQIPTMLQLGWTTFVCWTDLFLGDAAMYLPLVVCVILDRISKTRMHHKSWMCQWKHERKLVKWLSLG